MGDLVHGGWRTPEERAFMRALDGQIATLTLAVEVLREARAREREGRWRPTAEIITLAPGRGTRNG